MAKVIFNKYLTNIQTKVGGQVTLSTWGRNTLKVLKGLIQGLRAGI